MAKHTDKLNDIITNKIYTYTDPSLGVELGKILKEQGKTLSVAESCTGGTISQLITLVPGASSYYLGSVTSYAISVKNKVLNVPIELINNHGVVSSQVAEAMAKGVRQLMNSDYAIASTGFAGPGGGDAHYPEGTAWIGFSSATEEKSIKVEFHGTRQDNIKHFALSALVFLLYNIK